MEKIYYYIGKLVYKTIGSKKVNYPIDNKYIYGAKYSIDTKYSLFYSVDDCNYIDASNFKKIEKIDDFNNSITNVMEDEKEESVVCGVTELAKIYEGPNIDRLMDEMFQMLNVINKNLKVEKKQIKKIKH